MISVWHGSSIGRAVGYICFFTGIYWYCLLLQSSVISSPSLGNVWSLLCLLVMSQFCTSIIHVCEVPPASLVLCPVLCCEDPLPLQTMDPAWAWGHLVIAHAIVGLAERGAWLCPLLTLEASRHCHPPCPPLLWYRRGLHSCYSRWWIRN